MIIVSQDKKSITNFDNINTLRVTKTGKIMSFDNSYRSSDDCSDVLGTYNTEERAKEVLQEIARLISVTRIDSSYQEARLTFEFKKMLRYEMPEE